jgi:hypothetical protein
MATALRRLRLKRVSLVDTPANQAAQVVLFKSADCECTVCKEVQSTESRNALSDADFAAVWTDAEGRKQRKLPIHDAAHVRNALARWSQTDLPADVKAKARRKLEAKAKELGIGDYAKQQPTGSEVNVPGFPKCPKCDAEMEKGAKKCTKCGEMMPDMEPDDMEKADDRPKEDAVDEKIKADLADATAKLTAATAEIEKVKAERDALQKQLDTPEAIEKRKLEALPASVRERIEKQESAIRKLEDEKAERESIDFVKSALPQVPGKYEEIGKLLKRAKDAMGAEDFEALVVVLKAASAQIETGKLFREIGKRAADAPGDPLQQINALVDALVAKDANLKRQDAMSRVISEHPELYEAYSRSTTIGHKAASAADAN